MPLFEYTARNPQTGQIQKGQLDVPSKDDVTSYLRKNRHLPTVFSNLVSVSATKVSGSSPFLPVVGDLR